MIADYDWYRPPYARRRMADDVRKWFTDAVVVIVTLDECEAGIGVLGRKR